MASSRRSILFVGEPPLTPQYRCLRLRSGLLQCKGPAIGGQVEPQSCRLRVQLDHNSLVVLEVGNRTPLDDRDPCGHRGILAAEILWRVQVVHFTFGVDPGSAYIRERASRKLEFVLLLVLAVVERAVSP